MPNRFHPTVARGIDTPAKAAEFARQQLLNLADKLAIPSARDWGTLAANTTLDIQVAEHNSVTLGGNITLTLDIDAVPDRTRVRLEVIQDGTGSRTVTWANVLWLSTSAPTLRTIANTRDLLEFTFVASAGVWLGRYLTGFHLLLGMNNASLMRGVTSAGVSVKLFRFTADANNITRFIAGVDAGGFQWSNQAETLAWMSLTASGLRVMSGSLGYGIGAGGTVTQTTSRTTGVTLNKACGQITTDSTSLAAGAFADFVVTNSTVNATDTVSVSIVPGGTGSPVAFVVNVAAGSFTIRVFNQHAATADTSADVINFAVIRVSTS